MTVTSVDPHPRTLPRAPDPRLPLPAAGDCFAFLLAGGRGSRLHELTAAACKPAVPFGTGKIIDYVLSSAVEAGLSRMMVATQYRSETLLPHLAELWAPRFPDGLAIREGRRVTGSSTGYPGTAGAVQRNLAEIDAIAPRELLVLAADHVYRMDFAAMIAAHRALGAAATVAVTSVPVGEATQFGVATVDGSGLVTDFHEKPARPRSVPGDRASALVSMGFYVFEWDWLRKALMAGSAPDGEQDFGKDILPRAMTEQVLVAHRLEAGPRSSTYWRDVGTLDAYRCAHLDLDAGRVPQGAHTPAARRDLKAPAGCSGTVLLPGAVVPRDCRLIDCIIDSGARLPAGLVVGEDAEDDARWFRRTSNGTTLVTGTMLAARQSAAPSLLRTGRPPRMPLLPPPFRKPEPDRRRNI